jgi:hypothetical protein
VPACDHYTHTPTLPRAVASPSLYGPRHGQGWPGKLIFAISALRVEFFSDEEASNWHFRVPALHINGAGPATRADAERESLAASAFALEGDPRDYDRDAETVTLDVSVAPAA